MLTLITATPGSGKTLHLISILKDEKTRPIYYYGIPDLTLDWDLLHDPYNWGLEVPDNAIIVIDEVQKIFPVRDPKKPKPVGVSDLETHRHRGIDLYFITQHGSMLDVHARRLVGTHIHLNRNFGADRAIKYTANGFIDVKNYHELKTAEKTMWKFPKDCYGLYKSAEVHTHKRHIPKILYFIPFGIMLIAYLIYNIFDRFDTQAKSFQESSSISVSSSSLASSFSPSQKKQPIVIEDFKEAIAGVPESAPVYNDLWTATSFPKLACVSSKKKCLCYTEQGTRYFIDELQCRKRVKYGYYDITQETEKTNQLASNTNHPDQSSDYNSLNNKAIVITLQSLSDNRN